MYPLNVDIQDNKERIRILSMWEHLISSKLIQFPDPIAFEYSVKSQVFNR